MWEQISANRTRSIILVIFMGAVLIGVGFALGDYFFGTPYGGVAIAAVVWIIMTLVAYFQGDSILLATAGARKIEKKDHPRLFNVVEEMTIACGLAKMPDVYIIDDPALNAFATGRDQNHAAVAITSGLLQKLNRDELQGVIAHEMSHVKNRDVLLMSIAAVLLGTVVILSYYFSRMIFFTGGRGSRRSSDSGGSGGAIIAIVGILFIILAPIFTQLLYFALSRRREYLADASAALYTRYPEGLASALEKLAASTNPVAKANQATAPMYIVNPFRDKGRAATDWTSTHPPISERIRILRQMGHSASLKAYEDAYEKTAHSHVLPHSALAGAAAAVETRAPSAEGVVEEPDLTARTRETQNMLFGMANYRRIDCSNCGTTLRLPPNFTAPAVRCPHCGTINAVN
ncbi:zinc finger domain-containing protein [Dehalogenimonas etheniformans]|uniref:Protease HtpX homolog n=1 Tax=Dehalogenimonas etheniformans TaxID=1536648 RepID=A0A2P5P577_9CHLR|nr:M48 family metalloprotease [Dehalogenimonas etheniformans]PPD57437.1 peptidase M28 [Dehalogenimonas etheniformans]QNT76803.1 M48 family metalloprotease [Dehalogenimonas etheniformans]